MRSYFSPHPCKSRLTAKREKPERIRHTQDLWTQAIKQILYLSIARTISQSLCGSIDNSHIRLVGLSLGLSISRHIELSNARYVELSNIRELLASIFADMERTDTSSHYRNTAIFRPCNPLVFPLFSSLFLAYPRSFFRCFRGLTFAHDRRGNGLYRSLFAE